MTDDEIKETIVATRTRFELCFELINWVNLMLKNKTEDKRPEWEQMRRRMCEIRDANIVTEFATPTGGNPETVGGLRLRLSGFPDILPVIVRFFPRDNSVGYSEAYVNELKASTGGVRYVIVEVREG